MSASTHSALVLTPSQVPEDAVPIDVTWFMPNVQRDPYAEFLQKRLPNARRMDLDVVAEEHPLGLKHMMPTGKRFAEACETIGVSPSSQVVLYDSHGVFSSPRALFMFKAFGHQKAAILNGGLPRWISEGKPIESGTPKSIKRAVYPEPDLDTTLIRGYEEIVKNTTADKSTAELVLDARSRGRFTGKDPEPRPGLSSGHMPNSSSLPFTELLASQPAESEKPSFSTLLAPSELRSAIEKALGPQEASEVLGGRKPVVNSCGSGMTAAVIWLALKELGVESAIYDESWTGYAMRSESRIVKD